MGISSSFPSYSSPFSFIHPNRLRMDMHLSAATAMPCREQDTATATLVLDVLCRAHDVGNAAQAAQAAETKGPGMRRVARLK